MPCYQLDTTSGATIVTSLRDALQSAGLLEQVYYLQGEVIIFKTNRFAHVFYVGAFGSDKRPYILYGTSYGGGGNVNNSVLIVSVGGATWNSWWLVVNSDAFAIVAKETGTSHCVTAFFTRAGDTSQTPVFGGSALPVGAHYTGIYRADTNVALLVFGLWCNSFNLWSAQENRYYQYDPVLAHANGSYFATGLLGMKAISRHPSYVGGLEVYGTTVVLATGSIAVPTTTAIPLLAMPDAT
ncbi:MAG: hypothetical protein QW734_08880 [Candidatus Bathyarchaeia archaeon]